PITNLQGWGAQHVPMKSLTPIQRDRSLERLRKLTFGAAAGSMMALLGISYVAAASYAGKSSSSSSTALNASTSSSASDSSSSSAADSSSQSSTTDSSSVQSSAQAPTTGSSGSGTVTSGGS